MGESSACISISLNAAPRTGSDEFGGVARLTHKTEALSVGTGAPSSLPTSLALPLRDDIPQ